MFLALNGDVLQARLLVERRVKKEQTITVALQPTPSAHLHRRWSGDTSTRASPSRGMSFLAESSRRVHALDYVGEFEVGTPPVRFRAILDTGSGAVLLPADRCHESLACRKHKRYNLNASSTSSPIAWLDNATEAPRDMFDRETLHLAFGAGEVWGQLVRDDVCLAEGMCRRMNFVEVVEASDQPFEAAQWDGVLGLAPDISPAKEYNLLESFGSGSASVFALFLGRGLRDGAEVTWGGYRRERVASPFVWVNLTVPGYWQIKLSDLTIGGKALDLGCSCEGCCQAVVDSGSSVIMGPAFLIKMLKEKMNLSEICTNKTFPSLGFKVAGHDGRDEMLELTADEYMDREWSEGVEYCLPHLMPVGETGRGPIVVLGMPVLRKFYTVFDGKAKRVGFALANQPNISGPEPNDMKKNGTFVVAPLAEEASRKVFPSMAVAKHMSDVTVPLIPCRGTCYPQNETGQDGKAI
uniref:Peptidase A1 domain-containing protein n=1 Tax=Noctiluca scintillans TaxID=2966 RepID=A0A7S1AIM3_NOCSC